MKKLAYLANYFPSLTETFIYREVMELKRRNVEVRLYSIRKPTREEMSDEAVPLADDTYYLLPVSIALLLKSHAFLFSRNPYRYVSAFLKMMTGTHRNRKDRIRTLMHFGEGVVLARIMTRDGITHIHAHYASQSASVARVIHLLTGITYSFAGHAHDIWHDKLLLPEKLEEAVFAVTCSNFARQWLGREAQSEALSKIYVVYHGLDVRKFSPPNTAASKSQNLILSVGSLGETKGFPDLISACEILRDRGFPFECVIIGEGKMRGELEAQIKSCRLDGLVRLVGAMPQEQIIHYYRRAWVFTLPCVRVDDGRQDGIPNVLMEAMATGLPVISTNATAQGELIEHGRHGLFIPPNAPLELAESIMKLCKDCNLRNRIATEAREKMVSTFDNRKTIEPLLGLFDRFVFRA